MFRPIGNIKIFFVPRPTCIITPLTVSLFYDWIDLRVFELDAMNHHQYNLHDYNYNNDIASQRKMFKFIRRNLQENEEVLKRIGIDYFVKFLGIIAPIIYKCEYDTSDGNRLEFWDDDRANALFNRSTIATSAPSMF